MNNRLHKVIFNKNTGLMAVVAESSHNNGKSSATDNGIAVSLCGLFNQSDCIKIAATNDLKVAYALQSQTTANNQSHYSVGSEIQAAGKLNIQSEEDITVSGSLLFGKDAINAKGKNIHILSANERSVSDIKNMYRVEGHPDDGTMGSHFIGVRKTEEDIASRSKNNRASQVESGGNINFYATDHYNQVGSHIDALGEVDISAKEINVIAAQNSQDDSYKQKFTQKGLTVGVSSPLTDAILKVQDNAKTMNQSSHSRVNAMSAANTAYSAYQAGKTMQNVAQMGTAGIKDGTMQNVTQTGNAGVKIKVTYGEEHNRQGTETHQTIAQASSINGEKVKLTAREKDINIVGSDVIGKAQTDLWAKNNVHIQAAKQTATEQSYNENIGGAFGVAVTVNNGASIGITAEVKADKGKADGDDVVYRHSNVGSMTGKTNIVAGESLNIVGGQVKGSGVDISAKDLHIESLQDTATYRSKQQGGSADVTIGWGGVSGNINGHQSKVNSDYASVNTQSGIFAGDDGYRINVQNHTDLAGALITSTQKAEQNGKNRFETGTLTFDDLANKAEYKGESFAIGTGGAGYGKESDKQYATTHSGINTANITITNSEKQQQITGKTAEETIAAVKTDLTIDNYAAHSGSLKNNFDKDKVQNEIDVQVEVTKQAAPMIAQGVATASDYLGKVKQYENKLLQKDLLEQAIAQSNDPEEILRLNQALNEVDTYLTENKARYDLFKEGGLGRAGLHAVGGGILTGDISGAVGAGTTSLAAPVIAKVADNSGSLKPVVDTVSGLAIGYTTGGTAGAFTGANADWNNRQLHYSERQWIKKHAEEFAKQYNIVDENGKPDIPKATERLAQQAARQTDFLWALALPGEEDKAAAEFLATANETFTNGIGKEQKYFTTQGNDFAHSEKYADDVGSDYEDYYKKYLISNKNNNINERAQELVKQKTKDTVEYVQKNPKEAAKKTGEFVWDTGKAIVGGMVDCGKQLGECAGKVKDEFVETGKAIGQGGSALANDSLQHLYGQDTRTAQALIFAGTLTEAGLTATGVGKAGGVAVKTAEKAAIKQAEKKAAQEAAENARKAKQAEINAGLDGEMVSQPQNMTGKFAEVRKVNIGTKIDDKVVLAEKQIKPPEDTIASFAGSQYLTVTSTEEITTYRTFGGSAKLNGQYVTTETGLSRQELAVYPKWSSTQFEAEIVIPKGETFNLGFVEHQPASKPYAKYRGGADQIHLERGWDYENWVKSVTDKKTGIKYSVSEFKQKFPDLIYR